MSDLELGREPELTPTPSVRRELIEAGAGCGKTYSLVSRYIEALGYDPETGKMLSKAKLRSPSKILALTFTEDAAFEMKERVLARLQGFALDELALQVFEEGRISTFHGFCFRALKPFLKDLGYTDGARLLPQRIVRERRLRYLFAALDRYDAQTEVLAVMPPNEICELGVDLWFKVLGDSDRSLTEIQRELEGYKKKLHILHAALREGSEEILAGYPDLRDGEKMNWVRALNMILHDPTLAGTVEMNFATGPRKIKEEFVEIFEAAQAFRELLKDIGPTALAPQSLDREISSYREVFRFFEHALAQAPKWLDFEALEFELLRLLRKLTPDEISAQIGTADILLVDEFQDTSPEQLGILERISKPESEWYFVGDPKQSIYSFRKADVSIFLGLKTQISGATLDLNRRSEAKLLGTLNQLSSHFLQSGPLRHRTPPQDLRAHVESCTFETPVTAHFLKTGATLPDFADLYRDIQTNAAVDPNATHGVLFLTWNKLFDFGRWLQKRGVGFEIAGREKHLDHQLTLVFCDYLAWCADPLRVKSYFGLRRWWLPPLMNEPQDFADPAVSAAQRETLFGPEGPFDSWQRHLQFFCELVHAKNWRGGTRWTAAMERLLSDLETVGLDQIYGLDELARFLGRDPANLEADISDFDGVLKGQGEKLRLMTIHGSKGLEFDCVYLPNLYVRHQNSFATSLETEDSTLGFDLTLFDEQGLKMPSLHFKGALREKMLREEAEKLRLFYVAITRAKKRLHLYLPPAPKSRPTADGLELLGLPPKSRSYWSTLIESFRSKSPKAIEWIDAIDELETPVAAAASENERAWLYPLLPEPEFRESSYFRGGVRRYIEIQNPAGTVRTPRPTLAANEPRVNLAAAELGILFHELMERWNGNVDSLDTLTEGRSLGDVLKAAALAVRELPRLAGYFENLQQAPGRVFREGDILISGADYLLNGIADAYWIAPDGTVTLLDWKTSFYLAGFNDENKLTKIHTQLALYGEAFRASAPTCFAVAIGVELGAQSEPRAKVILDQKLF